MNTRDFRRFSMAGAMAFSALALSGCMGGTTYGTGVSQEEQTLKDVYTMFNLQGEKKNIDYSPRPDLIVPDNKQALVEPLDNGCHDVQRPVARDAGRAHRAHSCAGR